MSDDDYDIEQEIDECEEEEECEEYEEENEENEEEEENEDEEIITYNETIDNDSVVQIIVKEENKLTSESLSKFEIMNLIGVRATQISNGSSVFVDVSDLTDPVEMAKKEILNNKCPLLIKRFVGNNKYEIWNPNEMFKILE